MAITAADVAKLRELTGAGMMDAKRALEENGGDIEKAIDALRKSGAAKAAKKAERATAEGKIFAYTHGNKLAVVVELLCETDFVARNDQFNELGNDLAMHIAASAPQFVSRDQVSAELVEREKGIYREQLAAEGKPAEIVEKIIDGKLNKFYEEICLLDQKFIKDEDKTVQQLLNEKVLSIGENLKIGRFVRMQLGG
ncbi:MAG: Elongation factor Ts [Candidatus Uhrbacteria bacterium GW2011_GWD2_52_7]|uniref:Elongation factor Ts n=1 Tax=Candidatus Uhrbacteria bacterium GW2011_GWD2_52_7 TaxID=1618989 RepID=A0A0G1ZQA4_9BACT|nr:MAG: Elongation factor Ts [Candidatus Uhrbacteria bacterium GW2011_GWD2_52_7]